MAELIAGLKKPTVTLVLGGGHSIGVPLAVSGKVSMIVPSASMTIHPIRMTGMLIAAPQTYRYFHDMQERILSFVAGHSRANRETLAAMMMKPDEMANDVGTILDGEEAVRVGLIDEVGGLDMALGWLKGRMGRG
jgi:ATP-dependent protease ClpP protease subunit